MKLVSRQQKHFLWLFCSHRFSWPQVRTHDWSLSIVFVRGSVTYKCVGNHCSDVFSASLNPSRRMDTTILNLLLWLCPTSLLTVFAKLSLSVNTNAGFFLKKGSLCRRSSESFEPCALLSTNAETIDLIRVLQTQRFLCCQCGSDNSLS